MLRVAQQGSCQLRGVAASGSACAGIAVGNTVPMAATGGRCVAGAPDACCESTARISGRQIGRFHRLPRRHHGQPVTEILQLTHVAGESNRVSTASASGVRRLTGTPSARALAVRK